MLVVITFLMDLLTLTKFSMLLKGKTGLCYWPCGTWEREEVKSSVFNGMMCILKKDASDFQPENDKMALWNMTGSPWRMNFRNSYPDGREKACFLFKPMCLDKSWVMGLVKPLMENLWQSAINLWMGFVKRQVWPFGFHSVRHLTASTLYAMGQPVSIIQMALAINPINGAVSEKTWFRRNSRSTGRFSKRLSRKMTANKNDEKPTARV